MSAAKVLDDDPALSRILARMSEMPVLPHVIFQVMEISSAGDDPAQELERAIVVDPGFTSKLLSLANSAYFGLPRKVTSIRDAISFLGFKAIRQLAVTVGVFHAFVGKTDKDSLRRRRWWRHSVDTAVCCRWLARQKNLAPPDEAYTAGLLHYVGKTLLDRFGGESYEKAELLMERGVDDLRSEHALYGCDHIEVAVAAAREWGFPEELVSALKYREEPSVSDDFAVHRACVTLGSEIAALALSGWEEDGAGETKLSEWALDMLGYTQADVPELLTVAISVVAEAATMQF